MRAATPMRETNGPPEPERAPLHRPFTPVEALVVRLIAHEWNYVQIATELGITRRTVRFHAQNAAAKIPGTLPQQMQCAMWYRGATADVLMGTALAHGQLAHTNDTR